MAIRDDYLLRFINLLREAITEAMRLREAGRYEQALLTLLQAQEKLFVRPASEFIGLPLDQQLEMLGRGEDAPTGRAKYVGYASLLREAGRVYERRDRSDLAASAYQLALQTLLTTGAKFGPLDDTQLADARDLLARIPPDQLQPPLIEQLEKQLPAS